MYFKTGLFITYDEGKKFRLEDDTWRFMDWEKKTKKNKTASSGFGLKS